MGKRVFSEKVAFKLRPECKEQDKGIPGREISLKSQSGNKGTVWQSQTKANVAMQLWAGEQGSKE